MEKHSGVFSNLKMVAFAWAVVGPLTMKFFADHGATVLRIESSHRPCTMRASAPYKDNRPGVNRAGYFAHFNGNILSFALNMNHPRAHEVTRRLVQWCDIFFENYTPGVIEKWGLGYEELTKIKPDIIMLRQSGYGSWGPYKNLPAFGMVLGPIAGLPNFIGFPNKEPLPVGVSAYTDCISPRLAAAAVIAALIHREKTGEGQLIDLSQFETTISFILPGILEYQATGKEPERLGNSALHACPHGVYPCKGDDRWCTIAVSTEEEWQAFCREIGRPELIHDPHFNSLKNRKKHEEALNQIVAEWTINYTPQEVMVCLQKAGVPAGICQNTADLLADPQLRQRNIYWRMHHPELGEFTHLGQSFHLSRSAAQSYSPSPVLGEHTEMVCTKLLGMSDEEFVSLMQEGVFE